MKVLSSPFVPWIVEIDGEDLVVRDIMATCFGGEFDKGDNGETESGIMNDGVDLTLFGVALPIRSTEHATRHSPLAFKGPHIPWKTEVHVWKERIGEEAHVKCQLIDNGPDISRFPTHALDLNPNVAAIFAPGIARSRLANAFSGSGFSYRIIGGAKWIS